MSDKADVTYIGSERMTVQKIYVNIRGRRIPLIKNGKSVSLSVNDARKLAEKPWFRVEGLPPEEPAEDPAKGKTAKKGGK